MTDLFPGAAPAPSEILPPDAAAPEAPTDAAPETPDATTDPRRSLKVVLTLQPAEAGYQAFVAVGSDGCDPVLRSVAVPDLAAALDHTRTVAAEAAELWRTRPRYPTAEPAPKPAKPARSATTTPVLPAAAPRPGPAEAPSTEEPAEAPAGEPPPAPRAQLSLFGGG